MDTFQPNSPPDYSGNGVTQKPRTIGVDFGDGYSLSAPDGLNPNDATATFQWSKLSQDDYNYILDFYYANIGKTFRWDAPGDRGGTGKWRFTDLKNSVDTYNSYLISFSIKRSFELG